MPLRSVAVVCALLGGLLVPAGTSSAATEAHDGRHVLVGFRSGTASSEKDAAHKGRGSRLRRFDRLGVDVVRVPSGKRVEDVAESYERHGRVAFAEPNYRASVDGIPDDTHFSLLWGLHNTGQSGGKSDADVDAPEGWDAAGDPWAAADYAVGVVDTGIDAAHPDLAGRVALCKKALSGSGLISEGCADGDGHGTHVAGTIAAVGNNGQGVVGVAPNARLAVCKGLDDNGYGYYADIVACVDHLVTNRLALNLRVINMSLGGPNASTLQRAVDAAWAAGILVVAAAGNDGTKKLNYPAGYASVVSVAATDRYDQRASFSNKNSDVEVAAPGVSIYSTYPGSRYASLSGTSMATPHVAGAAALVSWKTGKTGRALRDAVTLTADDLGTAGRDNLYGHGRVNLCKALGGSCGGSVQTVDYGTVSGKTYRSGSLKSGVKVSYSGPVSGSVKSDGSGSYTVSLPEGAYTFTANLRRRTCTSGGQTSLTIAVVGGGQVVADWHC